MVARYIPTHMLVIWVDWSVPSQRVCYKRLVMVWWIFSPCQIKKSCDAQILFIVVTMTSQTSIRQVGGGRGSNWLLKRVHKLGFSDLNHFLEEWDFGEFHCCGRWHIAIKWTWNSFFFFWLFIMARYNAGKLLQYLKIYWIGSTCWYNLLTPGNVGSWSTWHDQRNPSKTIGIWDVFGKESRMEGKSDACTNCCPNTDRCSGM